jgi:hypothetical protein
MNQCPYCDQPIAMQDASTCGPPEIGAPCPCCGLVEVEEDSEE